MRGSGDVPFCWVLRVVLLSVASGLLMWVFLGFYDFYERRFACWLVLLWKVFSVGLIH